MSTTSWSNWAGNVTAQPARVARPASVDEVAAIVRGAADDGLRVKAVGSGHSFTPIAVTDGVLLVLDLLTGIVAFDAALRQVTVRAGTRLADLNRALAALGLAMPNLGDIDRQTISGALSTGTHGTGARFRGIADAVIGMRLVLADGTIADLDAATRPDLFEAARVGLGAFGIVVEVTVQCVDAFSLHAREAPSTLTAVLADLDANVDGVDHFEFYWFPHTDRVLTKHNTRLPAGVLEPLPRWRAWLDDDFLSNTAFERINRIAARRPSLIPRINQLSGRLLTAREFTLPSHEVFVSRRDVRFTEMEYAVPRAALPEALAGLRRVTDRDVRVAFPVEVRFLDADEVWLSTAYQRPSAYIAIHQYAPLDNRRYFSAFEEVVGGLGGRPHWGKMHSRTRDDLVPLYPRLDEAIAIRDRVDPQRRFANPYLDRVLGP